MVKTSPLIYGNADIERRLCESSLQHFIRSAWQVIEPATEYIHNWHIDCLPYEARVETPFGPVPIGLLVESGYSGPVLSYNHSTGLSEWKPVTSRMKTAGKPLVEIETTTGERVAASGKHPIYVNGEYKDASSVKVGDVLLRVLQEPVRSGHSIEKVLLSEVLPCSQGGATEDVCLRAMRSEVQATESTEHSKVLQQRLLQYRPSRSFEATVRDVRTGEAVWLSTVPPVLSQVARKEATIALRSLREGNLSDTSEGWVKEIRGFLQLQMLRTARSRKEQHGLHRREEASAIPERILRSEEKGQEARWGTLLFVQGQTGKDAGRSPRRQEQEKQRAVESGLPLSTVSQQAEGECEAELPSIGECVVSKVEQSLRVPEAVYNLEVEGNNNFFCEGILTHNCICEYLTAVDKGQITRLLINMPPRALKPVSKDAIVLTRKLGHIKLGHVRVGDEVLTHRGRFRRVEAVHEQGILPLLEIETHGGRRLRLAYDHPVLTARGWLRADQLSTDDVVATVHPLEDSGMDTISAEEARVLGYLIGDGGVKYGGTVFTNIEPDVMSDFKACVESIGFSTTDVKVKNGKAGAASIIAKQGEREAGHRGHVGPVRRWRILREIDGKCSYDKRVPSCVMAGNQEIVLNFLAAYWDCDGFIFLRDKTKSRGSMKVECCTVSEGLAYDIHRLLTRLGIPSRIRRRGTKLKTRKQGDVYYAYYVCMTDQDSVAKFMETVGSRMKHPKRLKGKEWKRQSFDSILNPDPIVSIRPIDPGECRCLTVEEDHSFTAEDIAVHNSITVTVMWPVWSWLHNPSLQWMFTSYSQNLSTQHSVDRRTIIRSDWYQQNWAHKYRLVSDQDVKNEYLNNHRGRMFATSFKGMATGKGGDRVVCDDPHDPKGAESPVQREDALKTFQRKFTTRLNDKKKGAIVVVMQRLDAKDLSALCLESGYTHLCLKAEDKPRAMIVAPSGRKYIRDESGLLSPNREGPKEIAMAKVQLGPMAYAAQYQQSPVAEGGNRFKRSYFRYWKRNHVGYYECTKANGEKKYYSPAECTVFCAMDPAGAEKEQNNKPCYTVILTWAITPDYRMILLDVYREQKSTPETEEDAFRIFERFQPFAFVIEQNGIGLGLCQNLMTRGVPVAPVLAKTSKEARSESAEIRMAAGTVYFEEKAHYLDWMETELLAFPKGEFVDACDALSWSAIYVTQMAGAPTETDTSETPDTTVAVSAGVTAGTYRSAIA